MANTPTPIDGLYALKAARRALVEAEEMYRDAFLAMMDSGASRMRAKAPDPALAQRVADLEAQYPKAAAYLAHKSQANYATTTGTAHAEAAQMLCNGATIEEAAAHMDTAIDAASRSA